MSAVQAILDAIGSARALPTQGSWPTSAHRLDEPSANALVAALLARRPLLVRGEPGVGKSQLARAAADILGRRFIVSVIQPNSEYEELLWTLDYTERLADAQLTACSGGSMTLHPVGDYISPGPIWYALAWREAEQKASKYNYRPAEAVETSSGKMPDAKIDGAVLLIDEIDKADIMLANGLLEVLGNGGFEVRHSGETVRATQPEPLVVLTSNNTRQLPAALLRRCVVLDLALPDDPEALREHLCAIGQAHFPGIEPAILAAAAQLIIDDRNACDDLPRTGQAEYIDLLRALDEVSRTGDGEWSHWLERLAPYFHKSRLHR